MNLTAAPSLSVPVPAAATARSWARRLGEATALVLAWMALGRAFRLDANAYLVAGIPVAVAFQALVARRPLLAAWVRSAPPFAIRSLGLAGLAAMALLAVAPGYALVTAVIAKEISVALWGAAGCAGAVGVVYAARHAPVGGLARDLRVGLVAALPGVALMLLFASLRPGALHAVVAAPWAAAKTFAVSLAQYVPICFALEEVVFRGVLDAHVARPEDGRAQRRIATVALLSLWGLWHLPVVATAGVGASGVVAVAISLVVMHVLTGMTLVSAWRTRATLLAPALAHALIDAVRNAALGG
jgi:hypothetical protein